MSFDALVAGASRAGSTPAAVLFALGVGLLAGLVASRRTTAGGVRGTVLAALAVGWIAGALLGSFAPAPAATPWIALGSVPFVGAAIALDARPGRGMLATAAALGGAAQAAALGAASGWSARTPATSLGDALGGATIALALGAVGLALVGLVRGPRTRIAARVAGSWIAAIGLLLLAWQARPVLAEQDVGCASCATARLENAWCDPCAVGWVAAFEVRSRTLFEALDAHGHDLDRDVMRCADCKRMMDEGGFCEGCRFGWVGGQAYMSRLTYHLAKGTPREAPGDPACARCDELFGGAGWCPECCGGWAGNVWLTDRGEHAAAVRELGRLRAAVDASERCEDCALAILVDATCPWCRTAYRMGEPVRK